jgi:hypothetical protein
VNFIHNNINTSNNRPTNGQFTFNGQITGLPLADFMAGIPSGGFLQGNAVFDNQRQNYTGVYVQDSWKVNARLTLNGGVRWEPFLPMEHPFGWVTHFDPARFASGAKSAVYKNAPAGLIFPGDAGYPGQATTFKKWNQFAPRLGLVFDPQGNGNQRSGDDRNHRADLRQSEQPPRRPRQLRFRPAARDEYFLRRAHAEILEPRAGLAGERLAAFGHRAQAERELFNRDDGRGQRADRRRRPARIANSRQCLRRPHGE